MTVLENMSCDILLQWSDWLTGYIIRPIATGITHTPIVRFLLFTCGIGLGILFPKDKLPNEAFRCHDIIFRWVRRAQKEQNRRVLLPLAKEP